MSNIFQAYEEKVQEQIDTLQTALYTNRAETIEDYRHLTGQLRGLTVSLNIMKGLQLKVENDELDD